MNVTAYIVQRKVACSLEQTRGFWDKLDVIVAKMYERDENEPGSLIR